MSQVKALIAGLLQNPAVIKSLIERPQALARLAGLGETDLRTLGSIPNALTTLLSSSSSQNECTDAEPSAFGRSLSSMQGNESWRTAGRGVALTGVVALLAVVGAVVTVSTVSLVALSSPD